MKEALIINGNIHLAELTEVKETNKFYALFNFRYKVGAQIYEASGFTRKPNKLPEIGGRLSLRIHYTPRGRTYEYLY